MTSPTARQVDVHLDKDFKVISQDADDENENENGDEAEDGAEDGPRRRLSPCRTRAPMLLHGARRGLSATEVAACSR